MKKILALVLAVVLSFGALSVFAVSTKASLTTTIGNLQQPIDSDGGISGGSRTVIIPLSGDLQDTTVYSFTGASKVKFNGKTVNGAPVLGTYDLDKATSDSTGIEVTFPKYTGTSTNDQTLKATIYLKDGTEKKKSDKIAVEIKYDPETTTGMIVEIDEEYNDSFTSGVVYKATSSTKLDEVSFAGADDVTISGKIAKGAKVNFTHTTSVPDALDEAYPWNDLQYFAVTGATNAVSAWTLVFEGQEEKPFVYGYKDGKLVNLPEGSYSYSSTNEAVSVKGTGSIPAIVLSATDLKVTATDATTSEAPTSSVANPGTGSSDMIGVAVVMAVVSLGAAGAVAFKKASK